MEGMSGPNRAVFRLPAVALVFPVVLLMCVIPLAGVGGWWLLMYLVPVVGLAWILVTRTVADPGGVRVRRLGPPRSMTWAGIRQLELTGSRWVVAIEAGGRRTRLPMVLPRDLPRLAAVSGGSFHFDYPDPDGSGAERPDTGGAAGTGVAGTDRAGTGSAADSGTR